MARKKPVSPMTVWKDDELKRVLKHPAWEYTMFLAGAIGMTSPHGSPVNHQVAEAFLVHARNLSDFFYQGVEQFRRNGGWVPRSEDHDDIYAVDFCDRVCWDETPFGESSLRTSINKTLSHLTYSRDLTPGGRSKIVTLFDGLKHLHGTVVLFRQAWDQFAGTASSRGSISPKFKDALHERVTYGAEMLKVPLGAQFDALLDQRTAQHPWVQNIRP
jgi:hypothetical protein